VRRSVSKDQVNWSLARNYTYVENSTERELDKNGKVKKTTSERAEVSILYGERYYRTLEKDGKPLAGKDEQNEEKKLAKWTAKREAESEQQRAKRLADVEKKRQREREFLKEVPDAFKLTLEGQEPVNGHMAYVIDAEPRPGYQARTSEAKYFGKIRARIWIDESDYQWVKVDAETTDTISFGLVLFRLYKGARLHFEQTRVNDEIWLPKSIHVEGGGRAGLLLRGGYNADFVYDNYRKFQTDSRIVATEQ
jgi:hypothetical protein